MSETQRRAADATARRAAQSEFAAPMVVEAGAGTGKTAVLVARIVAWSLGAGWERARQEREARGDAAPAELVAREALDGVVAITFTEAAAAQMATRTADALRSVEQGRPPVWIDVSLLPDEAERRTRARALLGALDRLGARTIHSFCRRILAENPIEAGLHPHFQVDADERAQREVIREVVEEALPELLADPEDLALLLARRHGPPEIELALLDLLRLGARSEDIGGDPLARDRIRVCLDGLRRDCTPLLDRFEADLLEVGHLATTAVQEVRSVVEQAGRTSADAGGLAALVQDLADRDGSWVVRLATWARGKLTAGEAAAVAGRERELALCARAAHRAIRGVLCQDPELLAAAHRVVHGLLVRVESALRVRGVATFSSLLRDARDLLRAHPAVASRLRARIRQLLVDEFQDTDPLQCEILSRLVFDAEEEERPGLFLVGDPKQSIYGWRSADLVAYDGFVAEVEAHGGTRHRLSINFRSVPAVLREVERVVSPVMDPEPGLQPPFEPLLACEERATERGFSRGGHAPVEHWATWAWRDGEPERPDAATAVGIEARAVAADMLRLNRDHGVGWGSMALLFRAASDLRAYLEAFRAAGVPFVVEGDRDYYQRREVVEAAALVRCVMDPADVLALLALIRSSIVGVPDAALLPLWRQGLPALAARLHGRDERALDDLREAIAAARDELPTDVEGLYAVEGWDANLGACLEDVAALRESFETDPADTFVERLRTRVLFESSEASRHPGLYRLANLERFFRDLETSLEDGQGDPRAILRILRLEVAERREAEEGRPKEAVEDAVQVMTIHKAKGLDFDHVYVVQLHKGTGSARQNRADWSSAGTFEFQLFGATTPGYADVEQRAERVAEAERVRTLYVALTRARERLVVAGVRELAGKAPAGESHAALLQARTGARIDLEGRLREQAAAGGTGFEDEDGVRWVGPGLPGFADAEGGRVAPSRDPLFASEAVESGWRRLARDREEAAVRMGRSVSSAISHEAHEALLEAQRAVAEPVEREADVRPRRDRPPLSRAAAMAAGTAVHRALELFRVEDERGAEVERLLSGLAEDEAIGSLAPDERPRAHERARELLARFFDGPFSGRFDEIAPGLVSRELPVLLGPGPGDLAPTGFRSGVVDLVYRDPASGELVVADYKTDQVAPAELEARCEAYALQGRAYVDAVQEALGVAARPRFELWLIDSGLCRSVDTG